jgi:hypothetical protein
MINSMMEVNLRISVDCKVRESSAPAFYSDILGHSTGIRLGQKGLQHEIGKKSVNLIRQMAGSGAMY